MVIFIPIFDWLIRKKIVILRDRDAAPGIGRG